MPRGDRTGPWGLGPGTGRGAGYCAGFPVPGFMNPGWFAGFGRGVWGGRGWRRRFWATGVPGWAWWGMLPLAAYALWRGWPSFFGSGPEVPEKQAEKQFLKEQTALMEKQLEEMKKRLAELEGEE